MKKRFVICVLLLIIIFLTFVLIRKTVEKYNIKSNFTNNIIKNYKYDIDNFNFFV